MDPLPMTAAARKKLTEAEGLLKQAIADVKVIKAGQYSRDRAHLVWEATFRVGELLREIETELDVYGERRRAGAVLGPRLLAHKPKLLPLFPTAT